MRGNSFLKSPLSGPVRLRRTHRPEPGTVQAKAHNALVARMADALAVRRDDEGAVPFLQRAGFSGPEMVAALDEATHLAALGTQSVPDETCANLLEAVARASSLMRAGSILRSCEYSSRRAVRS